MGHVALVTSVATAVTPSCILLLSTLVQFTCICTYTCHSCACNVALTAHPAADLALDFAAATYSSTLRYFDFDFRIIFQEYLLP